MKRKFLVILLAIASALCLVFGLSACAGGPQGGSHAPSEGLEFELNEDGASYTVKRCKYRDSFEIVIPSEYQGCPVISIGEQAFAYFNSLQKITIPASVTSIESYAFENCSSLNAVYITDLEAWCRIGFGNSYANPLYYAHHLYVDGQEVTDLHIPDGVTEIKQKAFFYCDAFTSVTIPASVSSIEYEAFGSCWSLQSVTFEGESKLTSIEHEAFLGCSSLQSITIPESVTSIGGAAFAGCNSLQSVTFEGESKLTSIEYEAFEYCSSLTSITIPESVTSIEDGAFYGCLLLTSVTFDGESELTSIGVGAFVRCSSLTSIPIPEGVTSIGEYAFRDSSKLTSITISESVTSIGCGAFYGCDSLQSVRFERTDGWKVSAYPDMRNAIDVMVGDPQTAAEYLMGAYCNYYWERT